MNDNHERILHLVEEALNTGRSPESICVDDPELVADVRNLLEQCRRNEVELSALFAPWPAEPVSSPVTPIEAIGSVVGPYKLLQQIGEGAFGTVYMAEQTQPFRRRVALKVIKAGMDTREVIARFEAERQALAIMDHPNIARVLDAGTTDSGRPYFVMELVNGVPLTTYCDDHRLTAHQRLQLMVLVCRAVQSAHQKGVIHRDLKPSNVLVTMHDGIPVPKVIDFGIAKATAVSLTDHTLFTAFGGFVGTPAYMSPEQAERSGLGIDTRTDVYGLGVLLYELLTGTTPIDPAALKAAAHGEVARLIREAEPAKPSTRLSTLGASQDAIAVARGSDTRRLGQMIRGELDWIVMKALEKDRTRRYDTAAALADDVVRYLDGEPVVAGPPSRSYRLRKVARLYRAPIGVAIALLAILLLGVVGTMIGLVREAHERRLAEARQVEAEMQRQFAENGRAEADAQRRIAQSVLTFLTQDMLSKASPRSTSNPDVRGTLINALIEPALKTIGQRFNDTPQVRAAVRTSLAQTLVALGGFDLALPQAKAAWQEREALLGDDHPDTIAALSLYANTLAGLGGSFGNEPLLTPKPPRALPALENDDTDAIQVPDQYASRHDTVGRYADAEPLALQAWNQYRHVLGNDRIETLRAEVSYAWILDHLGRSDEAESPAREAWEHSRRILGDAHPDTVRAEITYASILVRLNRYAEAEAILLKNLERNRRLLGDDDADTIWTQNSYAVVLMDTNRAAEAETAMRQAWERVQRARGDMDLFTIDLLSNYTRILISQGNWATAEPLLQKAWQRTRRARGNGHPDTILALSDYTKSLAAQGQAGKAVATFADVVAFERRAGHGSGRSFVTLLVAQGDLLRQIGEPGAATTPLREATDLLRTADPEDPERGRALYRLGICLMATDKPTDAEPVFREGYAFDLDHPHPDHSTLPQSLQGLMACLKAQGKSAELQAIWAKHLLNSTTQRVPTIQNGGSRRLGK